MTDHEEESVLATEAIEAHEPAESRRARFRAALSTIAKESSADDLIRWMLIPAAVLLLVGFNFMIFGWIGAARTHREIEQIPYLISGGLIGLGLVIVGALLLASTFWVAVTRKLRDEADERAVHHVRDLEAKIAALEAAAAAEADRATPANGRAPRRTVRAEPRR